MKGVAADETITSTTSEPRLQLLWSRTFSGPIVSAPSVANGKVYVGDWAGIEWALDSVTGHVVASADLGHTRRKNASPAVGISSPPLINGSILYVAGGDDGFYALDADTLAVRWRRSLGDNSVAGGYYGWCSPVLVGGKLLLGLTSNSDDPFPRSAITALDPATGEIEQATYFTEDVINGGVFIPPEGDTDHGKVLVTTSSTHSFAAGNSFSLVRLDLETLLVEERWKRTSLSETRSAEWGSSLTLFTDSTGRQLVGAGQKNGNYSAFDRNDLTSGPVWITPISTRGDVSQNDEGALSTAAFDGATLYVGGGRPPDADDPSVLGAVTALSPSNGAILWRHTFDEPVIAPVSYANGGVFVVVGKSVVVLDAATGSVLSSFEMKAKGLGGVSIERGRAYVGDQFGTIYAIRLR